MVDQVARLVARAGSRATLPIIAVGALVVILVVLLGREAGHHIASIEHWITDLGPAGRVVFVGLLVLGTSVLVPESLFGIAAGALFGVRSGFLLVMVGNVIAASIQYGLARRLLRGRIQHMLAKRPQLAAVQRAVLSDETRLQLLLRLTPLNPASLSYVFGAAGVRFWGFLFACIGLIPHLLMEVYLGRAGRHLTFISGGAASHHSFVHEAVTFGGLFVSAVVVFIVSRIARKAIERVMDTKETSNP
jgi:uncharacterized membrane protein YdjX (TVP38/TMEM64 family)